MECAFLILCALRPGIYYQWDCLCLTRRQRTKTELYTKAMATYAALKPNTVTRWGRVHSERMPVFLTASSVCRCRRKNISASLHHTQNNHTPSAKRRRSAPRTVIILTKMLPCRQLGRHIVIPRAFIRKCCVSTCLISQNVVILWSNLWPMWRIMWPNLWSFFFRRHLPPM